jgi:hypothetical protein
MVSRSGHKPLRLFIAGLVLDQRVNSGSEQIFDQCLMYKPSRRAMCVIVRGAFEGQLASV